MPFFFDLSSLAPLVERNPFEPPLVREDDQPAAIESEPPADLGLPIPTHYDFDLMRALVQDPFRLYVYWNLRGNPLERIRRIFPAEEVDKFRHTLRLIDETNNITVFFEVPYTREYWFSVFPDRTYRVELGVRSPVHGYIRLLSSQPVTTPRGGPSDQVAPEAEYAIEADEYLQVLRESHLIPERAWAPAGLPIQTDGAPGEMARQWEALPPTFRRILRAIGDIQAGREYERWWERLSEEELSEVVREFLAIIHRLGDGEMGYILLMRYLPELLRRAIRAEGGEEIRVDKPVALFLAERLGQSSSEMGPGAANGREVGATTGATVSGVPGPWLPSLTIN